MIDFRQVHHEENFDDSSLWHKMHRTLLLMYVHRDGAYFGDLEFKHARLLHLPEKDLQVIKRDWRKIKEMVDMGLAHEITEGMTHYLGACTKAANSASRTTQPCSSESAKPRAFSLKQSYMNSIVSQLQDAGSIITAPEHLSEKETFEDVVLRKIQPHFGRSVDEIHKEVGGELRKKAKSYYAALAKRLIGIEAKKVEEFEKANISIKTIRLKKNGMPKEAMSFPAFDYFDLLNETWEDDKENTAKIKECLEQRFFFVVFQYTNDIRGDDLVLKTAFFWTMPRLDLDGPIKDLWEETKCRIANGMADQLPSSADNPVGHVRPHGRDSSDTLTTPHDGVLVKKSFWLNQLYLKDVISKNYEQN
jgi:DNA mismatch repair protein MutH